MFFPLSVCLFCSTIESSIKTTFKKTTSANDSVLEYPEVIVNITEPFLNKYFILLLKNYCTEGMDQFGIGILKNIR